MAVSLEFTPESLVPSIPSGDSHLEPSVPPQVEVVGSWALDKSRSDNMQPAMVLKGVSWAVRKALSVMPYTIVLRKKDNGNYEVQIQSALYNAPWTEVPLNTTVHPKDTPGMRNQTMVATWDEDGHCLHQRYEFTCANGKQGIEHRRMRIKELESGEILLTNSIQVIIGDDEVHKVVVYTKKE